MGKCTLLWLCFWKCLNELVICPSNIGDEGGIDWLVHSSDIVTAGSGVSSGIGAGAAHADEVECECVLVKDLFVVAVDVADIVVSLAGEGDGEVGCRVHCFSIAFQKASP